MKTPMIIAYLKPTCCWSEGVRAVLRKYELPFEERDIVNNRLNRAEMVHKSGQSYSPCVEIDGQWLADVSGAEVEAYLVGAGLVQPSDAPMRAPTNCGCAAHA